MLVCGPSSPWTRLLYEYLSTRLHFLLVNRRINPRRILKQENDEQLISVYWIVASCSKVCHEKIWFLMQWSRFSFSLRWSDDVWWHTNYEFTGTTNRRLWRVRTNVERKETEKREKTRVRGRERKKTKREKKDSDNNKTKPRYFPKRTTTKKGNMPEKRQSERNLLQRKKKRSKLQRKINGLHSMISGRYSQTTHLSPKSKYVSYPGKGSYQLKKLRNTKGHQTVEEISIILSSISKSTKKRRAFRNIGRNFFSFTHQRNL